MYVLDSFRLPPTFVSFAPTLCSNRLSFSVLVVYSSVSQHLVACLLRRALLPPRRRCPSISPPLCIYRNCALSERCRPHPLYTTRLAPHEK